MPNHSAKWADRRLHIKQRFGEDKRIGIFALARAVRRSIHTDHTVTERDERIDEIPELRTPPFPTMEKNDRGAVSGTPLRTGNVFRER